MRIDLAGVDGEAAVQAVFVRTEEAEELFGSARYGQCQVRVGHDYRITVRLVRLRDFFVVGGFAEDVLVLAVVLGERGNKGVDFGRCHVAAEFAVGGELFQQAALAGGGGGFQILALGLFGFLGAVGGAVFTLCLMYFGFPFDLRFLESLFRACRWQS